MPTRRNLIRSSAGIGMAGAVSLNHTAAQTPESETNDEPIANIGDTRDTFDSEYGVGREDGPWVIYGEDDPASAYYYVLFNDSGIAETIEADFRHFETGGLPIEDNMGESRFVPYDGEVIGPSASASDFRATDGWYTATAWHSAELANATDRSGNVVVVDGLNYFGIDLTTQFTHTMVSMETFEVNELIPNDEFMGAHTPLEEWEAYSGEEMGMYALTFTDDQRTGNWIITSVSASVEFEEPIPVADANELTATLTPVGEIGWTTYIPPSPMGEEGIRLHGIRSELGETVTAQWVLDGEESGVVTKIYTGFRPVAETL